MNTELEKQLYALIGKITNKEDFEQVKDQLLKRGIESLLRAEMTADLGYQKGGSVLEKKSTQWVFRKNHKDPKHTQFAENNGIIMKYDRTIQLL